MTRRTGFLQLAFFALGLLAVASAWAQVTEFVFEQSLTPKDTIHTSEFRSDFDGRTITLTSPLYLVDAALTMEDTTPPALFVASCRPGRIAVTLSVTKYLGGYMGRALPEGTKSAATKWVIMTRAKVLDAQLAIQEPGRVLITFSNQSAVDILAALYEVTTPVTLFLHEVEGSHLAPIDLARSIPEFRFGINRAKKDSMAALAQTFSYCETMVVARR